MDWGSRSGFERNGVRAARCAALLLVVAGLVSCAARPEESAEYRSVVPAEAVDPYSLLDTSIGHESVAAAGSDGRHTVLALSAGGSDGAFGAGVLAGWTESGTRPKFDVVTGVSTGALQAVLAFLGPKYDPVLKHYYTTLDEEDVFRDKGLGGLLGDSLYDNEPLRKQIEKVVTPELLAEVAAEHDMGRRLYIGTTNLDAGELTIWDMGKIAKGGRANSLLHFQKVVRASAAVPGFFRPVYIKPKKGVQLRQAHVDGGVKAPVLVTHFMFQSKAKKKELYLIVNGTLDRLNDSEPVKPNVTEITRKAISELLRELQEGTIYRDYVVARNAKATFRLVAIPKSFPKSTSMLDFDQARMRKLYETGVAVGSKGTEGWLTEPPDIAPRRWVAGR